MKHYKTRQQQLDDLLKQMGLMKKDKKVKVKAKAKTEEVIAPYMAPKEKCFHDIETLIRNFRLSIKGFNKYSEALKSHDYCEGDIMMELRSDYTEGDNDTWHTEINHVIDCYNDIVLPQRWQIIKKLGAIAFAAPITGGGMIDYVNWICVNKEIVEGKRRFTVDKSYVEHVLLQVEEKFDVKDAIKRDIESFERVVDDFRQGAILNFKIASDEQEAYANMGQVINFLKSRLSNPGVYEEIGMASSMSKEFTTSDLTDLNECSFDIMGMVKPIVNAHNKDFFREAKREIKSTFPGVKFDKDNLESFIKQNLLWVEDDDLEHDEWNSEDEWQGAYNIFNTVRSFFDGNRNEVVILRDSNDVWKWNERLILKKMGYGSEIVQEQN